MNISLFIIIGLSFSIIMLLKRLSKPPFLLLSQLSSLLLITIITIELFYGWLISSYQYYHVPFLLRLNTPFVFLIGPAIYFLIRSHFNPLIKWNHVSAIHFLPFLGVIIYFIPLYFSPIAEKLEYINELYTAQSYDSILIGGFRRIHQISYLIAGVFLIRKVKLTGSKKKPAGWIYAMITSFSMFLILDIYRYFYNFDLQAGIINVIILSFIAIYLVFVQIKNPVPPKQINPKANALLKEIADEITHTISREKIYLNPKIGLEDLSNICNLQKHTVSQAINQILGSNFNELINEYRVNEAIELLQSQETTNLTIKAIAEMAGFNTVSSFNANFRKFTGKSPREFRS